MSNKEVGVGIDPVIHRDVKARSVENDGIVVYIPRNVQKCCGIEDVPDRVNLCSDRRNADGCIILKPVEPEQAEKK